jgi:ABC-type branched-subunit amino acid transport system permease subunit
MSSTLIAEQLLNGLQFGLMLFLIAAGLTLVFGILDILNVAHGSLYMAGAYVAAQAVGGVANWLSGKTDAEIDALKANTGYANARALEIQAAIDKEKLRRANLNAGYTTINPQSQMTVNPNAVIQQPWAPQTNTANTGLIAGARG